MDRTTASPRRTIPDEPVGSARMAAQLEQFLSPFGTKLSADIGVDLDFSEIMQSVLAQFSSVGRSALIGASNSLINILVVFILVPFLTYYLLKDFKRVGNNLMDWLPNSRFELGWLIYHNVTTQLQAYTRGVMLQSLVMATVCAIGFSFIGLDIPILMACISGVLNLAPYLGPIISMVLSMLVGAAMSPFDPSILYLSVLVIIVAQIIDNVIVIPRIIANAVNLHPVSVILGILVIGSLFGTLGVILAIPAIAAGKIVYNNLYADILNASRKSTA